MAIKFLGKFDIQAPSFNFDQTRHVSTSRSLRRRIATEPSKVFTASFPLDLDTFGTNRMASDIDAHINEHFDGTPFMQEWPQHLGTEVSQTITTTQTAAAGANTVTANLSFAAPTTQITTSTLANIVLTKRTNYIGSTDLDANAAGEWHFVGDGQGDVHAQVVSLETIRDHVIGILLYASTLDVLGGVRSGDRLRFTQGSNWIEWTVTGRVVYSNQRAVLGLARPPRAHNGDGNVRNTGGSVRITRQRTTVTSTPRSPLVVGRYITFGGHDKLYIVEGLSGSTLRFSPGLYLPVGSGAGVDTSPEVPVRYAPEMETGISYTEGVIATKTIAIEEAWPDRV